MSSPLRQPPSPPSLASWVEGLALLEDTSAEGLLAVQAEAPGALRVLYANPAAARTLGWGAAARGAPLASLPGGEGALAVALAAALELPAAAVAEGGSVARRLGAAADVAGGGTRALEVRARPCGLPRVAVARLVDVSEVRRAEGEREASAARLHQVLDHLEEAFVRLDARGRILMANAAAGTLFNRSVAQLLGMPLAEVTPAAIGDVLVSAAERVLRAGEPFQQEVACGAGTIALRVCAAPGGAHLFARDVTRRVQMVAELRRQEERFRSLVTATSQVVWGANAAGRMDEVSATWTDFTGQRVEDARGMGWLEAVHPEDRAHVQARWLEAVRRGQRFECECRLRRPDGAWVLTLARAIPVHEADGRLREWVGTHTDISASKRVQLALIHAGRREHQARLDAERQVQERTAQLAAQAEALRTSLREKEVLLKEVHHRVKNNLQVISSLLSLQARDVDHPRAQEAFRDSQARVRSIALFHEKFYQSRDVGRVDLGAYVRDLALGLFHAHDVRPDAVRLAVEADAEVALSVDQAIPCGLIVNELVTNALKYAFPGGRRGLVEVRLARDASGVALSVQDDGAGLPPEVRAGERRGLGLHIVSTLTEQLGGQLTFEPAGPSGHGAQVRVVFQQDAAAA